MATDFNAPPRDFMAELAADTSWQNLYRYRLLCNTRHPREQEFEQYLEGDEHVVLHTGHTLDCPGWAPDIGYEGCVAAICVNDHDLAVMLKIAIGDCRFEEAQNG
jgi:hypothetical protein